MKRAEADSGGLTVQPMSKIEIFSLAMFTTKIIHPKNSYQSGTATVFVKQENFMAQAFINN